MHNGKVHGHGYSGNLAEGTLTAFHFDYRRGRTNGDNKVSLMFMSINVHVQEC